VLVIVAQVAPLGERWSIDALRRRTARPSVASFGTVAVLLQPIVVFSSNAILKHRGDNWYAGEALEIALRNDVMTIYLGNHLVEYASLLTVLNYIWVTLLAGSAVFLLVPVGRLRSAIALIYMGTFAGMLVTMTIGVFPLALIAAMMPFLTAPFWDAIGRRLSPWVDRLPTVDHLGRLGRPPIERRLLASVRDRGYGSVTGYATAYAKSLLTVFGLLMVVWMLLFAGADVYEYDLPDEIDSPHLDQQTWGLYAPDPTEGYSWYVLKAGVGTDRVVVDLPGTTDRIDRPPDASAAYETFRHRKYMQRVRHSGEDDTDNAIAEAYAEWACGQVAESHPEYAERVTLYQIYQPSPLDGTFESWRDQAVIRQDCPSD